MRLANLDSLIVIANMTTILLFAIASLTSWILHKSLLTPPVIYGVGWLVPSLATTLETSNPWYIDAITWFAIWSSYIAFCFGYLLAIRWGSNVTKEHAYSGSQQTRFRVWAPQRFMLVLIILAGLGFAGFAINLAHLVRTVGLHVYVSEGFRAAERVFAGVSPIVNYMYFVNIAVLALCVVYVRTYGRRVAPMALLILSFLALLFHGVRGTIVYPVVIATFIGLLLGARFSLRPILAGLILILLAFGLVTIGREGLGTIDQNYGQHAELVVRRIVLYTAPNYANLQGELENRSQMRLGMVTLSDFIKAITLGRVDARLDEYGRVDHEYLVDPRYNIGTHLRPIFVDFGWAGIIAFSFIIGCLSTVSFLIYKRGPSIMNLFVYALVCTALAMAFFNNHWVRLQYWWLLGVVFWCDAVTPKIGVALRK